MGLAQVVEGCLHLLDVLAQVPGDALHGLFGLLLHGLFARFENLLILKSEFVLGCFEDLLLAGLDFGNGFVEVASGLFQTLLGHFFGLLTHGPTGLKVRLLCLKEHFLLVNLIVFLRQQRVLGTKELGVAIVEEEPGDCPSGDGCHGRDCDDDDCIHVRCC